MMGSRSDLKLALARKMSSRLRLSHIERLGLRVGEHAVGRAMDVWEGEKEKTGRYLSRASSFVGRDDEQPRRFVHM